MSIIKTVILKTPLGRTFQSKAKKGTEETIKAEEDRWKLRMKYLEKA